MYKRARNGLLAIVLVVLLVVDISVDVFGAIWAFCRSLTLCSGLGTGLGNREELDVACIH